MSFKVVQNKGNIDFCFGLWDKLPPVQQPLGNVFSQSRSRPPGEDVVLSPNANLKYVVYLKYSDLS